MTVSAASVIFVLLAAVVFSNFIVTTGRSLPKPGNTTLPACLPALRTSLIARASIYLMSENTTMQD